MNMIPIELPNKYATCPKCGEKLDASTSVTKEAVTPKEGDIGVCFKCGTLLEYEEGYFVHELGDEKLNELKILQPELHRILLITQQAILFFRSTQFLQEDDKCNGCIYKDGNKCELDTEDDSPCFRYDHYYTSKN